MSASWSSHKARVAADFGAAAITYDAAARLQRDVLGILTNALEKRALSPEVLLDLGCGTGLALPSLMSLFGESNILALDLAEGMVRHARSRQSNGRERSAGWLVGDAEALPLASGSLDLVFSSLAIQWCENTRMLFDELGRVLRSNGGLILSTLVEGTLEELRSSWQEVDPGRPHVNQFLSTETLTAEVVRVFPSARVEIIPLRLLYPDVMALLRELKGLGARYKDGATRSGATAPGRLRQLAQAYERFADHDSMLPATYQVAVIQV